MKHKKTSFAILFGLLSLSLAVSGSATWIITSPTINGGPSNIREDNSVCYIKTGENEYYYSSLEGAIKDANEYVDGTASNATVVVIPNKTVYINHDTALHSGVDLLMPYTTEYSTTLDENNTRVKLGAPEMTEIRKGDDGLYIAKYLYTSGGNNYPKEEPYKTLAEYDSALANFADANGSTSKISSTLIIDEDVELTISSNSQMVIYGQLGRPGTDLNGHTSGYYSQVILLNGAKISVDAGGILDVRGYIKEANNVNEALNYTQIINNGTIYVPFVVYDYGGGTATIAIYAHANECPFSQYDMPNIHSTITTQNSGAIKARADLYTGYQDLNQTLDNVGTMGDAIKFALQLKGIYEEDLRFFPQQNACFVDVVGNSDTNILKTTTNSIVITKYNPSNRSPITVDGKSYNIGNTNNISKTAVSTDGLATTTIKAYGDINVGYLTLNVSIFEQIVPISTQNIYFPIPWQMNVDFYNGNVTISNMVKLLPGAQVRFTNCQINLINSVIAYNKTSWTETTKTYNTQQDSIVELNYSTLNIAAGASFGGYITLNQSSIENSSNYTPSIISVDSLSSVNASTTESEGGSMSLGDLINSGDPIGAFNNLADFMKGDRQFDDEIKSIVGSAFKTTTSNNISLNAQTDFNSKGNKTNIESGYKYTSGDKLDYFNDTVLVVDKVSGVTLKTASGQTETKWSEFNDQIIATINPAAARDYTVSWDDINTNKVKLTDTDNPLIKNIEIDKCNIDNGSYTATVTINITNNLDNSVVTDSITLYSYGPATTLKLVDQNGEEITEVKKTGGGRNDPHPLQQTIKLNVTSDYLKDGESADDVFDVVWKISDNKADSSADWQYTAYFNDGTKDTLELQNVLQTTLYIRPHDDLEGTMTVTLYKKGDTTHETPIVQATLNWSASGGCFEEGTIINTMSGEKAVENLTENDLVLSFNHYTGEYEYQPIFAVVNHGESLYDVVELYFSDNSYIGLIATHALYDLTLNRYVEITPSNYEEFIGHEFAKVSNGKTEKTTLIKGDIVQKQTCSYTVITASNYNCVANNMLNVTSMLTGFYNIFDYTDNMMYDQNQVELAIATYGLFTYEEWSDYVSLEVFNAINGQYFKLAVGNGSITYQQIYYFIDWYYSLIESGEIVVSPYVFDFK